MSDSMSIYCFSINSTQNSAPVQNVLTTIMNTSLPNRNRDLGVKIRVEDISYDQQYNIWLIDFGKFRSSHGPGKASANTPVTGFTFNPNEEFFEETACLYDQTNNFIIIQFNTHGVRHSKIQEYLSCFDTSLTNSYEFLPRIDASAQATLNSRRGVKKLTYRISPRSLSNHNRQQGTSLSSAIAIGNDTNGEEVEVTITSGRSRSSRLGRGIDSMISELRNLANNDEVDKLQISVIDNNDAVQKIDVLEHRLKTTASIIPGTDKRFPRAERYNALKRAYLQWQPGY